MKYFLLFNLLFFSLFANDFIKDLEKTPVSKNKASFEKALSLYNSQQFESAGDMFLELVLSNDKRGYSYLADIFTGNKEVNQDCKKAAYFAYAGMKQGDCRSFFVVSNWYKNGVCAKKDITKAKKYNESYFLCK